jgi:hypothetical protein
MKALYQHLRADETTKPYILKYDLHDQGFIELKAPNDFGLMIIAEDDGYGRNTGLYSVSTFHDTPYARVMGHLTSILQYYWYSDCSAESVVELFEELASLPPKSV